MNLTTKTYLDEVKYSLWVEMLLELGPQSNVVE